MSDTKWWRIRDSLKGVLSDEPMGVSEIGELFDRDSDKIYAGMVLMDMIHKGEISWSIDRKFTVLSER